MSLVRHSDTSEKDTLRRERRESKENKTIQETFTTVSNKRSRTTTKPEGEEMIVIDLLEGIEEQQEEDTRKALPKLAFGPPIHGKRKSMQTERAYANNNYGQRRGEEPREVIPVQKPWQPAKISEVMTNAELKLQFPPNALSERQKTFWKAEKFIRRRPDQTQDTLFLELKGLKILTRNILDMMKQSNIKLIYRLQIANEYIMYSNDVAYHQSLSKMGNHDQSVGNKQEIKQTFDRLFDQYIALLRRWDDISKTPDDKRWMFNNGKFRRSPSPDKDTSTMMKLTEEEILKKLFPYSEPTDIINIISNKENRKYIEEEISTMKSRSLREVRLDQKPARDFIINQILTHIILGYILVSRQHEFAETAEIIALSAIEVQTSEIITLSAMEVQETNEAIPDINKSTTEITTKTPTGKSKRKRKPVINTKQLSERITNEDNELEMWTWSKESAIKSKFLKKLYDIPAQPNQRNQGSFNPWHFQIEEVTAADNTETSQLNLDNQRENEPYHNLEDLGTEFTIQIRIDHLEDIAESMGYQSNPDTLETQEPKSIRDMAKHFKDTKAKPGNRIIEFHTETSKTRARDTEHYSEENSSHNSGVANPTKLKSVKNKDQSENEELTELNEQDMNTSTIQEANELQSQIMEIMNFDKEIMDLMKAYQGEEWEVITKYIKDIIKNFVSKEQIVGLIQKSLTDCIEYIPRSWRLPIIRNELDINSWMGKISNVINKIGTRIGKAMKMEIPNPGEKIFSEDTIKMAIDIANWNENAVTNGKYLRSVLGKSKSLHEVDALYKPKVTKNWFLKSRLLFN